MHYRPGLDARPLPYDPFKSCTIPRPIGWLSTVDAAGRANLAPYSQWQNVTFDPPMVMFAANVTPDGRRNDTVLNAEETGWGRSSDVAILSWHLSTDRKAYS